MACRSGIGTTIGFGTNSTYLPLVRSIGGLGIEREKFDCTHMGSPVSANYPGLIMRQFAPGDLGMPSELSVGILFDPDEAPDIPIDAAPEVITITWRPVLVGAVLQGTPATCVFTGFIVSYTTDVEFEGLMEGSIVIQPAGDMVFTAGVV